jgi:hypothetical protein
MGLPDAPPEERTDGSCWPGLFHDRGHSRLDHALAPCRSARDTLQRRENLLPAIPSCGPLLPRRISVVVYQRRSQSPPAIAGSISRSSSIGAAAVREIGADPSLPAFHRLSLPTHRSPLGRQIATQSSPSSALTSAPRQMCEKGPSSQSFASSHIWRSNEANRINGSSEWEPVQCVSVLGFRKPTRHPRLRNWLRRSGSCSLRRTCSRTKMAPPMTSFSPESARRGHHDPRPAAQTEPVKSRVAGGPTSPWHGNPILLLREYPEGARKSANATSMLVNTGSTRKQVPIQPPRPD